VVAAWRGTLDRLHRSPSIHTTHLLPVEYTRAKLARRMVVMASRTASAPAPADHDGLLLEVLVGYGGVPALCPRQLAPPYIDNGEPQHHSLAVPRR
jgi:hypothetical protein